MPLRIFFPALIASILLVGCGTVERPKGEACVAFAQKGHRLCYNFDDFDANGNVKPGVRPTRRSLALEAIDKHIVVDPDSYASLKAFVLKHKSRCEEK